MSLCWQDTECHSMEGDSKVSRKSTPILLLIAKGVVELGNNLPLPFEPSTY